MMHLSRYFIFFISFHLFLGNLSAQDELDAKADDILKNYITENGPGVSVILLKDNELVLEKNAGYANLEEKTPITSYTKFNLGTLSQQFTAMGIMILKDEEKLTYKDKISKYISDLPDYAKNLTIENLLEQTSGLPYLDIHDPELKIKTSAEVVQFLNGKNELDFKTGSRAVSNPVNYALLTLILENTSGMDYRSFVTERIFHPLEMNDSEVYKGGLFYNVKNKAEGYQNVGTPEKANFEKTPEKIDKEYFYGVTGIFVSPKDMIKWLKAWDSDVLISRSTLSQALRINFIRGAKEFYGYGWRKAFNRGKKYLYQGGVGYGFTHVALSFPQEKLSLVILTNQRAVFGLRKRAFELVNLFADQEYEVR